MRALYRLAHTIHGHSIFRAFYHNIWVPHGFGYPAWTLKRHAGFGCRLYLMDDGMM